jgi:hypothetical protein
MFGKTFGDTKLPIFGNMRTCLHNATTFRHRGKHAHSQQGKDAKAQGEACHGRLCPVRNRHIATCAHRHLRAQSYHNHARIDTHHDQKRKFDKAKVHEQQHSFSGQQRRHFFDNVRLSLRICTCHQ